MRSEYYPELVRKGDRQRYIYGLGWRLKETELVERHLPGVPKNLARYEMLSFLDDRWTDRDMERFGCVCTLFLQIQF